jgi:flagellar hook-associated protein 3 FlgL
MRVSTGTIYDLGVSTMQRQTSTLMDLQQQVATGRRVVKPSDDPVASSRALEVGQAKSVNAQFATNRGYANDALAQYESELGSITDILTYVRSRAIEAGNGTYSQSERDAMAADLRAQFDALVGIGNTRDSEGNYIFAGYSTDAPAFSGNFAGGISYDGDQGERKIQVSSSRVMAVSNSGDEIFMQVPGSSNDLFGMVSDLVTALEDPTANLPAAISTALTDLDNGLDNVLQAQASIGSRRTELDALDSIGSDFDVQYAATLSRLKDVDYAQAISDLTLQQTYLEAAQQSFVRITGLSLFNFLG